MVAIMAFTRRFPNEKKRRRVSSVLDMDELDAIPECPKPTPVAATTPSLSDDDDDDEPVADAACLDDLSDPDFDPGSDNESLADTLSPKSARRSSPAFVANQQLMHLSQHHHQQAAPERAGHASATLSIYDANDAIALLAHARAGGVRVFRSHLSTDDKALIGSGEVYIYDSGCVERWTDNVAWSKAYSTKAGWLIYKEVEEKRRSGSPGSKRRKVDGLCKKILADSTPGSTLRLVAYTRSAREAEMQQQLQSMATATANNHHQHHHQQKPQHRHQYQHQQQQQHYHVKQEAEEVERTRTVGSVDQLMNDFQLSAQADSQADSAAAAERARMEQAIDEQLNQLRQQLMVRTEVLRARPSLVPSARPAPQAFASYEAPQCVPHHEPLTMSPPVSSSSLPSYPTRTSVHSSTGFPVPHTTNDRLDDDEDARAVDDIAEALSAASAEPFAQQPSALDCCVPPVCFSSTPAPVPCLDDDLRSIFASVGIEL
jgi:hypothetical protein